MTTSSTGARRRTLPGGRPRWASTVVFAVAGAGYGGLASRIPALKAGHDLTEGELGVALFAFAVGAIAALPVTNAVLRRSGGRPVCLVAAPMFPLGVALAGLAPSYPWLLAALTFAGAFNGSLDVSMNANGAALERRLGTSVMQSLHGGWSVGLAAGGLVGVGAAAVGASPAPHLVLVGVLLAVVGIGASVRLHDDRPDPGVAVLRPLGVRGELAALAFVGVLAVFVEASLAEWSGVYVGESLGGSPPVAAGAFAVLAVAMTVGRLGGDPLLNRLGLRLVVVGSTVAAVVLSVALVVASVPVTLVALAVYGLGIASVFPAAITVADRVAGTAGITVVAAAAYTSGLAGPPLIGFVAEQTSLGTAFAVIVAGNVAIALLFARLRRTSR